MGLRALAEADLEFILEDSEGGFGYPITLTNPDGDSVSVIGFSNDIALLIDPETGTAISGRRASIALRISSLSELPVRVSDRVKKPWLAAFADINGNPYTFKIAETHPDRAIGIVTCMLELYDDC